MAVSRKFRIRAIVVLLTAVLAGVAGCSSNRGDVNPNDDARKIFEKGNKSMAFGNYNTAIRQYEYLEAVYPFSEFAKQAQLDLMYAYYRAKEPDAAIEAADRFLLENPTHPRVDYAYYIKGLVYFPRERGPLEKLFKQDLSKRPPNHLDDCYRAFATIATKYPDSIYAEDARQRIVYVRSVLAKYEIHVASFYVNRGAFVAAANRAKYVLENFQQTPSVVPALQIMVASYRQLELPQLEADTMRVLKENYPDQAFAYGEKGTKVQGTLLERLILRRKMK